MGMNIIIIHCICINKLSKTKEKNKDNIMGGIGVFNKLLEGRVSIQLFIHIVSSFWMLMTASSKPLWEILLGYFSVIILIKRREKQWKGKILWVFCSQDVLEKMLEVKPLSTSVNENTYISYPINKQINNPLDSHVQEQICCSHAIPGQKHFNQDVCHSIFMTQVHFYGVLINYKYVRQSKSYHWWAR